MIVILSLILISVYLFKKDYISRTFNNVARRYKTRDSNALYHLLRLIDRKSISTDPLKQQYSGISWRGTIYFESKSKRFANKIPLNTIKFIHKDGHGYYRWEAQEDEYNKTYNSNLYKFIKKELVLAYQIITKNKKDSRYQYILNRYELAFSTIITAIEECENHVGHITKEVEQKAIHILKQFISETQKISTEKEYKEELLKDATNKSVSEMLDFEIECLKI